MKQKLMSRKFWVAVAAFLFSISNSVAGMTSNNPTLVAVGAICGTLSAAIYAFSEAYVDAARALQPPEDPKEVKVLEPAIGFEVDGEDNETEE